MDQADIAASGEPEARTSRARPPQRSRRSPFMAKKDIRSAQRELI